MKTLLLLVLLVANVFAAKPACHLPAVMEGVLIGMQFKENPLQLLMCLKQERVTDWHDMIPAISFINWHDNFQMIIGFFHILRVHLDTLYDMNPCSSGEIEEVVTFIRNIVKEEGPFIFNLLTKQNMVEHDVKNFLHAWHHGEFEVAGRTTGNMLFEIFQEFRKAKTK